MLSLWRSELYCPRGSVHVRMDAKYEYVMWKDLIRSLVIVGCKQWC